MGVVDAQHQSIASGQLGEQAASAGERTQPITRKLSRCGQEGCERAERNLARGNGRDHRRGPESVGAGVYCRLCREPRLADAWWTHEHDSTRSVRGERRGDEL